jgi:type IV secretory pathway VirB10-like protein
MNQSTIRKHMRTAIASSFAAMLIIAGGIGHALAEDDDDELPDTKFFRSLLTNLGLKKDGTGPDIEYRERAPLVVPPTRDLPAPQTTDPAAGNPAWPVDQDEKRRREAAKQRKREKPFDWTDLSRQLGPGEMKKGTATAKDTALSKRSAETPEQYQQQSTPSQLGYMGGLFGSMSDFFTGNNKDETAKFEAEPPRASLTDPPSGYRSPSPNQPYGVRSDSGRKAQSAEDRVNVGTGSTSH